MLKIVKPKRMFDPDALRGLDLDRNPNDRLKFVGAINAWYGATTTEFDAAVQELTTESDLPKTAKDALLAVRLGEREIDVGWRTVFDYNEDYVATNKSGFSIRTVGSGVTFAEVKPGQKAKIAKLSKTSTDVNFLLYGAALQWLRSWFEDQDWVAIADVARDFNVKALNDMAGVHYDLLDALSSGINLAWQGSGTDTLLRDIATINAACAAVKKALEASYDTTITSFVCCAPIDLMDRINRALSARYTLPNSNAVAQVQFPVTPVFTTRLSATDKHYVGAKGFLAKSRLRRRLEVLEEIDILADAYTTAAWMRYGAAIADEDQFQRCATA